MRHFLQAAMLAGFGLLAASPAARGQVTVDQVLSREHPAFDTAGAHLGPGPDGSVYLGRDGYLMRLDPAGRKTGALFQGRVTALAANSNGVLAAAVAHFTRSVVLFDASFREIGRVSDFLNSDKTEWFAPCDVQAGASGDFYGFDENRDRILRIRPPDRVVQAYSTEGTGEKYAGRILRFRVCEKPGLFYILNEWGQLHALTFEGQKRWTLNTGLVGNPWNGYAGAFDADGDGNLYLLKEGTNTVDILSPDARSTNRLVLAGEPGPGRITALRLLGREILVRRSHPIELFRAYSRDTGKLLRVAKADAERLSATFASRVWTAGAAMPFSITLEKGGAVPAPAFRVFAAPFGTTRWQPLAVTHGQVAVPTNLSGLCQVTVTTDLRPGADDDSGYRLRDVVEIRQPGVSGTVSAWTPSNRVAYAAGEPIPFQAVVRTTNPEPVRIEVRLVSADGGAILFATNAMLKPGELLQAGLPPSLTVALRPGAYALAPTAPGLSAVPQWLEIGARRRSAVADFDRVVYGDYQLLFPKEGRLHQPDAAAAHVRRSVRLGASLFVDRVGSPWAGNIGHVDTWGMDAVGPRKAADARKAMEADPSGPAPDKLDQAPPFQQTVAAYGAAGLSQMALLMNMDAGLPIGQPHDTRKPEEFERDIQRVTRAMGPYAGFRGWTWVANWWVNEDGMAEESQRAAYKLALEQAKATGAWSPILEEVGARKVNYAVEAQARFARALAAVMTNLVTASAGPWRRPEVYPPATFGNVDEVDLHVQGEQMAWPNWYAHAVDWQERPGRRSWGHPELQNDGGTGEQVLPTLWTLAMRGADGIGSASSIPPWQNADRWVDDPRSPASGAASVFRSAFQLFKAYGPWLSTLEKRDPVLIPVSRRMVLLDGWTDTLGGEYFSRLFRAQQTCLYAKRPASFVFAEDLKPGMLESAKAILVVGQTVAFDPEWPAALKAAADRGVPIFYDASCRTNLVASFRPLDLSFARGELDPFYWQCDSAYGFLPEYFRGQAPRLERSLEQAGVAAVAAIPEREVLATERVSEGGRFLVVVNNTIQPVAMGLFWRQNLYAATRVPLVADVTIPGAEGQAVYDVLAMKRVDAPGGLVKADLRSTGARLYAVLPQPVGAVAIQAP